MATPHECTSPATTDAKRITVTRTVAVSLFPSLVAMMAAVPAPIAVTRPFGSTLATVG
jgi:hypothetical protein